MFEYSGSLHMHSVFSDGTGKVEEIAKYANDSGLDFIILTDHNNLKAKEKGFERWFGNIMLIVGYEVNDLKNKNHYLALGLDEVIGSFQPIPKNDVGCSLSANEYVKAIKDKGGIGFLAHPDEIRNHLPDHPAYPWTAWDCNDFDGIEIWNHMSEWAEGLTDENKIQRFLHPLRSIIAPFERTLKRWDELNMKRRVSAIGGVDAHAHKQNILGFFEVEIFPYKVLFKSIRTHVFLDKELNKNSASDFELDKKRILNSLKEGKSFIVNHYHGDGRGFRFCIEYDGETFNMGEDLKFDKEKNKKMIIRTLVPKEADVKLIHNGICIDKFYGADGIWDSNETGVYRIECWIDNKGWIFSNHIRVN